MKGLLPSGWQAGQVVVFGVLLAVGLRIGSIAIDFGLAQLHR